VTWHLTGSVDEFAEAAGDFLRSRPVEDRAVVEFR
jgi:hypothetical protein